MRFFLLFSRPRQQSEDAEEDGSGGVGGGSKAALLRKSLNDKGWAEKQTAGFTNWLNFTLVGAEQPRGGGDREDEQDQGLAAEMGGVSSTPLKAMVVMVSWREESREARDRLFDSVPPTVSEAAASVCVRAW